ncbi:hypothetical protein AMJ57_04280 [Parcubacteria bacterium SG8_24]|nr:MAG: hypothetical protein AMJ57_04280 [Parcubacteria bacterium SG8_24]
MGTRINKWLAEQGRCSRREADRLIRDGRVLVNGKPAELGDMVDDGDDVRVVGLSRPSQPRKKIYIALNKPVGFITTTDQSKKDNVLELVGVRERIFPIGRLDVRSSGLLLLTNDGELADRLMHPRYGHEKEYFVELDRSLRREDEQRLCGGVELEDGTTLPAKVKRAGSRTFLLTLREGRNRQIRRMCEALGYEVKRLRRIRIASIKLGRLKSRQWRHLTTDEVRLLKKAVLRDG